MPCSWLLSSSIEISILRNTYTDNCTYNVPLFRVKRVVWYAVGTGFVVVIGDVSNWNSSYLFVASLPPFETRLLNSHRHLRERDTRYVGRIHLNPD